MSLIELGGDPIGIAIGIVVGLVFLGAGFRWLVKRQDLLYAKSEELHLDWLEQEKAARAIEQTRADEDRVRLQAEIGQLRETVTAVWGQLAQCRADCSEARRREAELAGRVRTLETQLDQQGDTT